MGAGVAKGSFAEALYFAEGYHFTLAGTMFEAELAQDLEPHAMLSLRGLSDSWGITTYRGPSERGEPMTWESLGQRLQEAIEYKESSPPNPDQG